MKFVRLLYKELVDYTTYKQFKNELNQFKSESINLDRVIMIFETSHNVFNVMDSW